MFLKQVRETFRGSSRTTLLRYGVCRIYFLLKKFCAPRSVEWSLEDDNFQDNFKEGSGGNVEVW
jgi:hypothetical protein